MIKVAQLFLLINKYCNFIAEDVQHFFCIIFLQFISFQYDAKLIIVIVQNVYICIA